jgi:HK97 family phage prohead protease
MEYITQRMKLKDVFPEKAKEIAKRYKKKEDDIEFIRKGVCPTKVESDEKDNAIVSYITTKTKDRDNEIVDPEGAILDDYRKNPVVLWGHNYTARELPLGKNLWIKKDNKGLIAKTQYYLKDDFAKRVYEYRKDGFPLAESIGFIPLDWEDFDNEKDVKANDGARRKYNKWLLLEYSDVVVPSNPDAVAIAMKQGLVTEEQAKEITETKEPEPEETKAEETPKAFSIDEIYNILKENKELKYAYEILKQENEKLQLKAGAVLNKTNKGKLNQIKVLVDEVLESAEKEESELEEEKQQYNCECIKCGYKMKSDKHCKDLECPECGGEMRRVERPGEGTRSIDSNDLDVIELGESDSIEVSDEQEKDNKQNNVIEVDDKFVQDLIQDISKALNNDNSQKLFDNYKEKSITEQKKAMGKVL